ncbi:chemotaxis protein [Brenneria goodwinii]|uniref:Chemotaxis protein n=1 Tax=Brenneria goodwinii TaxID=1109412 RepID=A0A0G4JVU3_9GAMM|nr:methyl-accepting chemotaxis protein [Brenneria goodwinii]ATA26762.1 chemotaxis protein [Brenneria goodwinii]MCG8158554.1 MCP four helix bundle domain-containing protein [Brenneria goodwinii]MCG8161228.1 MCP four helix bundle domain-containing protein [Brenneria goodwinii]MCG8168201.1 MCP four helix bundle domain-containing protein [Brenneria goodwinii]MCG8171291.1 MCP four helix bundle domain-containing protein [Brenneria goodwinii]
MRLSDWKIGTRLVAWFILLVIMICFVSLLAISRLSGFYDNARDIVEDIYPQTVDSNRLIDNVNAGVLAYQKLLVVKGEDKIKAVHDEITNVSADIVELMNKIETTATDPESRRIMDEIKQYRADFKNSGQKIIDLVAAGDQDAAIDEFNTNTDKAQGKYRIAITKLIDHQDNAMATTINQMAQTYSFSRWLLLGILFGCIVFGSMIAVVMTRSITLPINQALLVANRVAKGDLTSKVDVQGKDESSQLLQALEHMNTNLREIVSQVREGAESITTASSQIAAGNQDLSARTEEQASSLEQTASSMEELTSTIKNTADNTHQATGIANRASDSAQRSSAVMTSVTQKMRGIQDSSQRMAEIIGVIDGIAFQTNILALNAAVEAARAGEQGRGFAVVAGEVRSLAQRSATAAKEIKDLIDDSVGKIHEGMQLVDNAEENISDLTTHVLDVNAIISEIAQASNEQSDGINQINIAVGQIDSTTQQNAALVEESASAALSLQSQASILAESVRTFKLGETSAFSRSANTAIPTQAAALPAAGALASTTGKTSGNSQDWTSF